MGGPGSGSWVRWDKKGTVEDYPCLDVRELRRYEIKPGSQITVQYDWRGEKIAQEIYFDWTPCTYGGYRLWFLCMECGRRVAVLYLKNKYFACRVCNDLTYQSCQESDSRFSKFFRNHDGSGSGEAKDWPLYALKGYLNRARNKEESAA